MSLSQRNHQPEIMDEPDLDPHRHAAALHGLERINGWSGSARILWPPIRELARRLDKRPLQLLDVATGAGDVPIRLGRKAQRAGVPLRIMACDRSSFALEYAQDRAKAAHMPIEFFAWDALREDFPSQYDVITCSLFLHHLDEEEAVAFLGRVGRAARHLVLINDLDRSRTGYLLAYFGSRILTASPVVHTDGPRSVEGAFTRSEVLALAGRAGLHGATAHRRWPCRFLLQWSRG
jgi:2-polyprenyl-3-methyl-5-hydroxy-6-metoxy-1,4-benzoquinol methylase